MSYSNTGMPIHSSLINTSANLAAFGLLQFCARSLARVWVQSPPGGDKWIVPFRGELSLTVGIAYFAAAALIFSFWLTLRNTGSADRSLHHASAILTAASCAGFIGSTICQAWMHVKHLAIDGGVLHPRSLTLASAGLTIAAMILLVKAWACRAQEASGRY